MSCASSSQRTLAAIATSKGALPSVDVRTKEPFDAAHERSDICAVAAAPIVGEAMVAITLCDALLEKFGGDSLRELVRNVEGYRACATRPGDRA